MRNNAPSPTAIDLHAGGRAVKLPGAILVYNFADDDNGQLSQLISAAPGVPVVFLSTKFHREVFSQAEGHNRTFILAAKFIDRGEVDPVYPAMWLSEGDVMPDVPGNVQVTATADGFRVDTLPPDTPQTIKFE